MRSNNWTKTKLGDLVTLINGRGFKSTEWSTQGLPIIRISNLNGDIQFNFYLGDYEAKHLITHGDLLFSWSGNRGTSFGPYIWKGQQGLLNQHIFKVTPKDNNIKHYLYQLLKHLTSEIEKKAHGGSGLVHVRKSDLENYEIYLPSLEEQQKIADILSSVDEAIEKTEAIIDQTETVKKGLMQQLLTRGIGHTEFKGTETGAIPTTWENVSLGDVIETLKAGVSVNSENRRTIKSELGILKTSSVSDRVFNSDEHKAILPEEYTRAAVNPKKDHIIISRMNTPSLVGSSSYIDKDYPNLFLPDRLWQATVAHERVYPLWLSFILTWSNMREKIGGIATGTSGSMKNISKQAFLSLSICLPSLAEQKKIAGILQSLDNRISTEMNKVKMLKNLKSGLMGSLLTGKVRVHTDQPEEVLV